MSFDNRYPNRKDRRKPYRDSRRFDRSCRCHGSCDYCSNNRAFRKKRREMDAAEQLEQRKEYDRE